LKVKLGIAEEVEKALKEKEENEKEKGAEKTEETTEKKEDVKEENVTTEENADEKPEDKSETLTNGTIDSKVKLVNGDSSSIDNDSTAVNTPGSSTPLPKLASPPPDPTDSTSLELTADALRLQTQHLQKLLNFLETEFAPTRQKLKDLLENNDMKFGLLWCLFRLGSVVTFKDHESSLIMAGEVPTH